MNIFSYEISEKVIYLIIIVCIAYVLILIDKFIINKIKKNNKEANKHIKRSQNTVLVLIQNVIKYIIIIIAFITSLKVFGIDTTALVTGIGAVSVVAGLAFQDVLKDYLVGISILLERQFAIGEIVKINNFKGEVIFLSLKTTKIKSPTGEVKIISNRHITDVINYSLCKNLITFEISVSYEDNNEKVEKVINNLAEKLPDLVEEITEPVNVDGIEELTESSVVYRLSTYSSERNRFIIKRKVNREIKKELDKKGIKIPYPQLEVHNEK